MSRVSLYSLVFALMVAVIGPALSHAQQHPPVPAPELPQPPAAAQPSGAHVSEFANQLDLEALGRIAVHTEGRVKSLDSFARGIMHMVTGPRKIDDRSVTFTYLDMSLRPQWYSDVECIYVKNKPVRGQIARALRAGLDHASPPSAGMSDAKWNAALKQVDERLERFISTGLISPMMLQDPAVQSLLDDLSRNVLTTGKFVQSIQTAQNVMNPRFLRAELKLIAPPGGGLDDPWMTLDALAAPPQAVDNNLPSDLREKLISQWNAFTAGWAGLNAPAVNDAAAQLASLLPAVNTEIYPEPSRLAWESWYFKMHNMTWVWVFYGLALVPLVLFVVYRWPAARWTGMLMFLLAFGLHTFAVMLRWYVSQRWPNSNMFEAVTTSAWFGGCLALLLEPALRRTPLRGLLALGSAAASMTALMAAYFLPMQLNPNISNMMPVLHDVWLYIHTNVIIFSYCLIFIASVTAGLYLIHRLVMSLRGQDGTGEYAKAGGAGSLIQVRPDGTTFLSQTKSTLGQVLDGTTMVVMEMSFILLWAGLVMGAIWADHSWGRPWGWDPKEVFALNTFLVFLVLVHGRLKVKDKGLWTAALALVGAGVMLFNWIIINFAISGLHSYA